MHRAKGPSGRAFFLLAESHRQDEIARQIEDGER